MKIHSSLLLLTTACALLTACSNNDAVSDARYMVLRVDVIEGKPGKNEPPAPFKVALVTGVDYRARMPIEESNFSNCKQLAPDCGPETVVDKRIAIADWGYVNLNDNTLDKLKPGQPYLLTTDNFALRNVTSYSAQASIYRINDNAFVKLKITLLKDCPAKISLIKDSIWKSSGAGIISIPTSKKIFWTELKADCMEQSDMQLSIK